MEEVYKCLERGEKSDLMMVTGRLFLLISRHVDNLARTFLR